MIILLRIINKGYITICSQSRNYQRGLNGFDPNCEIDGLEFALTNNPSYGKALFVWNELLLPNVQHIYGEVEKATNQKFTNAQSPIKQASRMGRIARDNQWIPDKFGNFHKPSQLSSDDLNDDFYKFTKLANSLGLKPAETSQKLAKILSKEFKKEIKVEDLEFIMANLDKMPEFRKTLDELKRKA